MTSLKMNRLLIVMFLFYSLTSISYGQNFPSANFPFNSESTSKIVYTNLVYADSAAEPEKIYLGVLDWIVNNMVDNKYEIVFKDKDLGKIICKGSHSVLLYTLEISIKPGGNLAIRITDLVYENWIESFEPTISFQNRPLELLFNRMYIDNWEKYLRLQIGVIAGKNVVEQTKTAIDFALIECDKYFQDIPQIIANHVISYSK